MLHQLAPQLMYASLTNNLLRISFDDTCPRESLFAAVDLSGNHIESLEGLFTANSFPTWLNISENMLFEVGRCGACFFVHSLMVFFAYFQLPPEGIHSPLLQELILDRNNLSSLEPLTCSWLPNLRILSANDNG